ncbi:tryptophan-rich sensory protein [Dyadobacter psychrotolerans]|uniref:Tryptophan-rich sensory protein n=1 Tax=Dyadobacter psychrotolerans TaxID=2541721 RepID=A0A4R5DN41_9BACT|nr:tryptophan-rich sensory protein [Dyadobacter psychrotolerans]TDE12123.1 tryptophan-rich sensory protein [Dyadobacter psychrotolerans]
MKKTLQISNSLALIITIIMNYLSNTGIFNNSTMASVSARYQNFFTPAGYAFSIWGLIYIGLAAFVVHQNKGLFGSSETPLVVTKIGWMFVLSCVANCLWILAWLYDYTGLSVIVMSVLLTSLLVIVYRTRMEMDLVTFKQVALEWWPFAFYLGWIMVAIIANVAAYLTKIGWSGFGISPVSWTIIMICVAVVIYIVLVWKRNLRESASVGAWGLIAVGVANWDANQAIAYSAIIAAAVLLIAGGIHGYKNKGKSFIGAK